MLWENIRYIAPFDWLISKNIQEWDLEKANISVLREANIIDDKEYNHLYNLPKYDREVTIGYMRRNQEIENCMKNGITEARRLFFELNNIKDENVLYIDNDSITTVHSFRDMSAGYIKGQVAPYLNFRVKNKYSSFYRLQTIDFLYYTNGVVEQFRLKNVNDQKLKQEHKGYFMDLLLSIAYSAQTSNIENTIDMVRSIYQQYVNRELEVGFYKEFNQQSMFHVLNTEYHNYYSNTANSFDMDLIDISFNAKILILLNRIFMTEYFKRKKR